MSALSQKSRLWPQQPPCSLLNSGHGTHIECYGICAHPSAVSRIHQLIRQPLTSRNVAGLKNRGDNRARTEDPPPIHRPVSASAGNGNFRCGDTDPNSARLSAETNTETTRSGQKPAERGDIAKVPNQVRALETGWWRMQSYTNPSPLNFPCSQGK
jgi:hypothetical protein